MAYTYTTYKTALATLMITPESDADFVAILPSIIDYAEQRCYQDLDLLSTTVRQSTGTLTANSRNFTSANPSTGTWVTIQGMNVLTPVGSTTENGTRNPVTPSSLKLIDFLYPTETASGTSVPALYAAVSDNSFVVGPAPDAAYAVEVIGLIRPTALSVSNTTTILSTYFPQLLITASMVFASGYQKNFSAASDDPQTTIGWEAQYNKLLRSAQTEEVRKKYDQTFVGMLQNPPTSGGTT